MLASSDIDRLVVPILQSLYRAPRCPGSSPLILLILIIILLILPLASCSNHHIYMSLIILLILSEDDLFNQTVHDTVLRPAQVLALASLWPNPSHQVLSAPCR